MAQKGRRIRYDREALALCCANFAINSEGISNRDKTNKTGLDCVRDSIVEAVATFVQKGALVSTLSLSKPPLYNEGRTLQDAGPVAAPTGEPGAGQPHHR